MSMEEDSMLVSFWSDEANAYVTTEVKDLAETHPEYFEGEAAFADADVLVAFGDVDADHLRLLGAWVSSLVMEDTVVYAGPASLSPSAWDGAREVLHNMSQSTGDPASSFSQPPVL